MLSLKVFVAIRGLECLHKTTKLTLAEFPMKGLRLQGSINSIIAEEAEHPVILIRNGDKRTLGKCRTLLP